MLNVADTLHFSMAVISLSLSVADVICSVQRDSLTVNEADGVIAVDISISRPVEKPFICEIESQPASAKGV